MIHEIPTAPQPRSYQISINGKSFTFSFYFCPVKDGGWILDILDSDRKPLVCGIAIVTGCDLLLQHKWLGIEGVLYCVTDGDALAPPTFESLGVTSHLLLEV